MTIMEAMDEAIVRDRGIIDLGPAIHGSLVEAIYRAGFLAGAGWQIGEAARIVAEAKARAGGAAFDMLAAREKDHA